MRDEFLALLAHELRNPLNAIATAAEVLRHAGATDPQATLARDIIERQTRRLSRLIDDLPDAARVMAGEVALSRAPFSLGDAVRRALADAQGLAALRGQTLQSVVGVMPVHADAHRVSQALAAVLERALLDAPSGAQVAVHLSLQGDASGDTAVLRIADAAHAGCAMQLASEAAAPPSEVRTPAPLRFRLAQRIAEAHGGSLVARASADGSVYEMRLPTRAGPDTTG